MALTSAEMQVKVDKAVVNMDRLNSIVNDADTVEVPVDVGTVPTIKKFFKTHGIVTPLTITASTANSATVSTPENFIAGKMYSLKPAQLNTGPYTLTVAATPYTVTYPDGSDLIEGDFYTDRTSVLLFNGTNFHLLYGYSSQKAAEDAVASLPAITANTMLVDNAAGTARETKTFADVARLLGFSVWSDMGLQPNWPFGLSSRDATIIGYEAAPNLNASVTTVRGVVALGGGALFSATDGQDLIAIGQAVMANGQPGRHNIGIGSHALANVTAGVGLEGSRNIGIGPLSLHFLTTGAYNVFMGRDSGHAIKSGSQNVGIGYRAVGAAENPIWPNRRITQQWELVETAQTGVGKDCLRWSDGFGNTATGYIALQNVKKGRSNIAFGAGALAILDIDVSYQGNAIDRTTRTGTYSQTGDVVTCSITGINAVVGNKVHVAFTSGEISAITTEYLAVDVETAPDANTFTFSYADGELTSASGNCTSDWVETATPAVKSDYNTALGYNAGTTLENGSKNVLIGENAGLGQGTSYSNKYILQSTGHVLMAGDFATGAFVINGGLADLANAKPLRVMAFGGSEVFSVEAGLDTIMRVASDRGDASVSPVIELQRLSPSPAANDLMGTLRYVGKDSADNNVNYADIYATLLDPTNGSEDTTLTLRSTVAGTIGARLVIGGGLYHSLATGGDKGNNTINFGAVYDDNTLLTCYPIEAARTGAIDLAEWDKASPTGLHGPARRFAEERMHLLDVDAFTEFWREHGHLPTLPSRAEWQDHANDKLSTGEMIQRLWETVDLLAIHIGQIREEGKAA